ncbi:hypoxanthine phosphoribosyltransferase [Pedobacter flavus]|uniref:Hypoxanthine phosphoribosyltransferase n=1 Tax=Pedobacter flavus TaxID=3113906 RepID=A0ABU7H1L2_9SPHI|nr:hypoxanthine phosphoribosyltransferase [Pedobacter sp. VNH31]MEE1884431.1 hypoxanthine phosphoribosyltransferase [Pedobacter sp. VNH31]
MNTIQIEDKNFELMIESDPIKKRILLLAIQIGVDYEDKCPIFIGVLNGSFLFIGDLMKDITIGCEIEFVKVSSYEGDQSTGNVKQLIGLPKNIKGRDIILVEDIVDTGKTLNFLIQVIEKEQPKSINICTLLHKPNATVTSVPVLKYVGFEIPNDFVVGYGLDYKGLGRNIQGIYRAIGKTE